MAEASRAVLGGLEIDTDVVTVTALGKSIGRHAPGGPGGGLGRRSPSRRLTYGSSHVNAGNGPEHSIRLNVQRRHLTADQKAAQARRLRAQYQWSQSRIAKVFGVSQRRVSQWLSAPTDDADDYVPPAFIEGEDGRTYEMKPRPPRWTTPGQEPLALGRLHLQGGSHDQTAPAERGHPAAHPRCGGHRWGSLLDDLIEA